MIAPSQRLPYVVWRNSRLIPLSEKWLRDSINEAADRAGYTEWDLAPHIAKAIAVYLEDEFNQNTITLDQLQEMLVQSIDRIGFPDVARTSVIISPRVSISLLDLAQRSSMELLFFPMLHQKMEDVLGFEARGLIFEEIRPCVKTLYQVRRWKSPCEELRDRIIEYIRRYLFQNNLQDLSLVIV